MEDSESDISVAEAKKQRENFTKEEWPTHRRSRGDGTCSTVFIPRCAKETRFTDGATGKNWNFNPSFIRRSTRSLPSKRCWNGDEGQKPKHADAVKTDAMRSCD